MPDPIEERVRLLEEQTANLRDQPAAPRPKDAWDKLAALSTLISGVIIASIGIWVNHSLTMGQQRAQDAQATATRTMEAAHNTAADNQAGQALKLQAQQAADSLKFQEQQASDERRLEQLRIDQQKQQAMDALTQQREHDDAALHLQQTQLAKDLLPEMQADPKTKEAALQLIQAESPKTATMMALVFSLTSANPSLQQASANVLITNQKSTDPEVSKAAAEAQAQIAVSKRIQAIVSVFETGKTARSYGDISHIAGRFTYGGFLDLSDGDLWKIANEYCGRPEASQARALTPYLDRLKAVDTSLENDQQFAKVLQQAAQDPIMQNLQDQAFEHRFWSPVQADAATFGLKLPLTVAMLDDTTFNMGRNRTITCVNAASAKVGGLPAQGADEKAWAAAFLEQRRANYLLLSSRFPGARAAWMQRTDFFKGMMDNGNWNLSPPFQVNGVTIL